MANTYTQLYIQLVFAVQGRANLIPLEHKEELYKYITGIVRERENKLLAINGMPDHIHILIGYNPSSKLSDLVRDIKSLSSKFINEKGWLKGKFLWQEGYGAFSYSRSHLDAVIKYIDDQEEHHRHKTFREEYLRILEAFGIEFDPRYLFVFMEAEK